MNVRKRIFSIFSSCFIFFCFVINILTVKDGQSWGDDFAHYLIYAKNIISGAPYASGILWDMPTSYPIGFPFILSFFLRIFGLNFIALKILNVFFWYGSFLIAFPLMKEKMGKASALLSCLYFSSSFYFFTFKQNILSDIPFSFFVALTICLFYRYLSRKSSVSDKENFYSFLLMVFFLMFSFFIRSAGTALVAGVMYYLLIRLKRWRASLFVFIVYLGCVLFLKYYCEMGPGFFAKILSQPQVYFSFFRQNYVVVFRGFLWSIFPGDMPSTINIYKSLEGVFSIITIPVVFCMGAIFVYKSFKRTVSFLECFLFFYFAMIFLGSSFNDPVQGFSKYYFPIFPYLFIVVLRNLRSMENVLFKKDLKTPIVNSICALLIVGGIVFNVFFIAKDYNFDDDVLREPDSVQLFDWVRNNVGIDEHYLFYRPRTIALMTEKVGASLWSLMMDGPTKFSVLKNKIKEKRIRYLIFVKENQIPQIQLFQRDPNFMQYVWQNAEFIIYEVNKDG